MNKLSLSILSLMFILRIVGNSPLQAQTLEENPDKIRILTVSELFQRGVDNSLNIKSAQIRESIADEQVKKAGIIRLPDVNIGLTGGYIGQPTLYSRSGLTGAIHPETPDWKQNYNAEIIQPLYQGGKIKHNIQKTNIQKQIAQLNTERNKAEIKLLLIEQYLDLFRMYKQLEVLTRNIEESEIQLHDILQMRKQGMITENDVIRSRLQLINYQLALQETDNNIRIVSQQLDIALGLDENLLLQPDTATLNMPRPTVSYDEYIQQAYGNYPELKIAQTDMTLAQKEIWISKADNRPSLFLRAANTLERPVSGSPTQDLFMNSWNVSLTLSYRLSSLYHNKHNINTAEWNLELEQTREELQKQEIRTQMKAAFIKHGETIERIGALTIYLQQANENYRIVRNKYRNQLAIMTDLLDAENVRLDAELQLTNAKINEIYTWYQLLRISGGI